VHTARVSTSDPDRFDITRKSGAFAFAPSWPLLRPYLAKRQAGTLTPEDWPAYVEAYTAEMRESYRGKRAEWAALLARPRVVLVCYCTDPNECHRTILARDILPKFGATYVGEIE
jgi:uncharacterized protein YeaO (DUF488 family)